MLHLQLPSQAPAKADGGSCIPHSEREILHLTSTVTDATPVSTRAFCGDGLLNAHEVMCREAAGWHACVRLFRHTPPI